MKKINSINEAKLGITIVQELLSSFTVEELTSMTFEQLADEVDIQNAYEEEDWEAWKYAGIWELYRYAHEVLKQQLEGR